MTGCLTPSSFETPTPHVVVVTSTFTPASALTPFPTEFGPGTATATLELVPSPTASLEALSLAGAAGPAPAATATSTVLPTITVLPTVSPEAEVAAAEQYTIDLINAQRAAVGVPPLARDETLMSIARARVADMVARGYTGHTDPVTGEYLARAMMRAAGYTNWYGENWYGTITAPPATAEVAMTWFMTDPPHANNILSPHHTAVGVGIAFNGQWWLLVQDFAGE